MPSLTVGAAPRARLVLALGALAALVALSGCSAAGSIALDPLENDTAVAQHAVQDLPPASATRGHDVRAPRDVVAAAVENGSTVVRDHEAPPLRTDRPVLYDGAVYEFERTVVGEREVPQISVEIDYNASDVGGSAVRYADLPAADRAALDGLLPPRDDRRVEGPDVGAVVDYAEPADSTLVGGETVVVFEGERYLVTAERAGTDTRYDYRYVAEQVAPDAAAYGERLRSRYAFSLSGLAESERAVVEKAAEDRYYADSDDDDAFAGVLDRFRAHDRVTGDDYSGGWIVRWDGRLYWADLRYGGFVD